MDYTNFVHAGAKLDDTAQKRLSEINQRLATLFTRFSQNLLADEANFVLFLERESDLAGLPESVRKGAAAAAETRGHKGQWAILNTRSSMEPFLTYSDRRDLREKVWRTYYSRGDNNDAHDNKKLITEILKLRAQRAQLLGFRTHADWRLENSMAKTPEKTMELMLAVWKPAVARVHEEVADMQAVADEEAAAGRGPKITIEPWDYRYYAERVRKEKYDLDRNAITPYLQLEKMREGLFYTADRLFGLKFTPVTGVPTVTPDVHVWEVKDAAGKHVGLWYFDSYARPARIPVPDERLQEPVTVRGSATIVSNHELREGKPGERSDSWDDATTLFHEFGHALHDSSRRWTTRRCPARTSRGLRGARRGRPPAPRRRS